MPTASWQAIRGRQIRNERHRHMRETLVHGCIREDMADHFRRALEEPYLVLAPESERHGTPRGRRDAQNADEQGKTWQTRETRRSGCSGGPRAGKCGTWQATRLAVRSCSGESGNTASTPGCPSLRDMAGLQAVRRCAGDLALIAFTGLRSEDMAGQHGARHLTAWTSAVAAALSTPRPRTAAGASPRRRNRPGVAASS